MLVPRWALMGAAALFLISRYALEKWRLLRRAERIGIGSLPGDEQLRLARQLEFYDNLLGLLNRRRITRRPQQTPLEFSQSLSFLPAQTYEAIRRLTELFYRVRYAAATHGADPRAAKASGKHHPEAGAGTGKWR